MTKSTCGVIPNLQKAFGTVDHQTLISKLKLYGIHIAPFKIGLRAF